MLPDFFRREQAGAVAADFPFAHDYLTVATSSLAPAKAGNQDTGSGRRLKEGRARFDLHGLAGG